MTVSTRARCSTTSATATSTTRCDIPSFAPTASMGSGRIDLPRTLTPVQRIARPFDDEHARFAAGAYGRPLLRMTFDFHANEQKQTNFIADICVRVGQAMGAERGVRRGPPQRYSIVPYQSTHNTGGAAMGTDPKTSALNRYNQTW